MGISFWQILLIVLVILVLFGAGKIPRLMGDMAQGINAFKKGMKDGDKAESSGDQAAPRSLNAQGDETAASASAEDKKDRTGA